MNMLVALVAFILVAVLIVGGVKVNLYLYGSGAWRRAKSMRSPVGAVALSQEAFLDDGESDPSSHIGQPMSEMSMYARKFFLIVLSIAVFVGLAIALFVNMLPK